MLNMVLCVKDKKDAPPQDTYSLVQNEIHPNLSINVIELSCVRGSEMSL